MLHRADYIRADVLLGAATFGRRLAERRSEALETLNERGRALDALRPRLAIRLGERDAVSVAFGAATEALLTIRRRVELLEDTDTFAWTERRQDIEKASAALRVHVAEFESTAVKVAGTRRPGSAET